jgi:hypothetical protein
MNSEYAIHEPYQSHGECKSCNFVCYLSLSGLCEECARLDPKSSLVDTIFELVKTNHVCSSEDCDCPKITSAEHDGFNEARTRIINLILKSFHD